MTQNEEARAIAAPRAYRAGMEVEPTRFTPPEVRPGPVVWEPYRAPRFGRRTRIFLTVAIFGAPALLLWAALHQALAGEGRARAASVFLLMPLVPGAPLLVRAWRDLWGTGER